MCSKTLADSKYKGPKKGWPDFQESGRPDSRAKKGAHNRSAQAQPTSSPLHQWHSIHIRTQHIKNTMDQVCNMWGQVDSTEIKVRSQLTFQESDRPSAREMKLWWMTSVAQTQISLMYPKPIDSWHAISKNIKWCLEISDRMQIFYVLFLIDKKS